jgi:hypothetical protein
MQLQRLLLSFALLTPAALRAQATSPLAKAWDAQAARISAYPAPLHLTVGTVDTLSPRPLPPSAVHELRTIYPTVGLEDSLRALYRVRLSPTLIGYIILTPSRGPVPTAGSLPPKAPKLERACYAGGRLRRCRIQPPVRGLGGGPSAYRSPFCRATLDHYGQGLGQRLRTPCHDRLTGHRNRIW